MEINHSPSFQAPSRLECKLHNKPIKNVHLIEDGRDYKAYCQDCLKELDKARTRNGSPLNFLVPENCHALDDQLNQFKHSQLEKFRTLKAYLSSVEKTFEDFMETVKSKKNALQESLQLEFDTQSDILSQVDTNYRTYQQNFKNLLRGAGDEKILDETIQLYSEVSRNTNIQTDFIQESQGF